MSPCCHGLVNKLELTDWESDTTSEPDRIMTRTPGHHATNPAKNPQNGPRALWVHTYSEPSSGNMRPSCAVTKAPGIRNVRNPRPQNTNAADPANCTVDAFGMNRTRATKMTTRSKEFSTLETRVGATCSEIMARSTGTSAAMEHLPRIPAASLPPRRCARKPVLGGMAGQDQGWSCQGRSTPNLTTWAGIHLR